jgi:hypothetical protein
VLYTGTGASRAVTGVGFQPDWVWLKNRSAGNNHQLFDAVRGVQKALYSDLTLAEATNANALTAFGSDGFTLGTESGINGSGSSFVSWNWRASNATAVTNTAGSITSTVSANTTSGFSVVTYTGTGANATIGHGLGSAPRMIIIKDRSNVRGWPVYHASFGNTGAGYLNGSGAWDAPTSAYWNNTSPTSNVFSVSNNAINNSSGSTYVAYCFAEVPGYSRFGSYTGNGSTDGPFLFCGFRPAYVMVKLTSSAGESWYVLDNKRNTANSMTQLLFPNLSNAELSGSSGLYLDFVSNGFKLRTDGSSFNSSGATYIFAAFAETPQKFALAR